VLDVSQYGYSAKTGRYVDLATGRFVNTEELRDLVAEEMTKFFRGTDGLGLGLQNGTVSSDEFQVEMSNAIRISNSAMFALGRGGLRAMTPDDFAGLENHLSSELGYLDEFMAAISRGELSPRQIQARVNLYAEAPWEAYAQGEYLNNKAVGFEEMRRIAVDDGGTCGDCHDYAAQGWQPLGKLPMPGKGSVCGRRCRCYVEYRVSEKKGRVSI